MAVSPLTGIPPPKKMNNTTIDSSRVMDNLHVLLDGTPVKVPSGRRSVDAIHTLLEAIALERHRVLWSFNVEPAAQPSEAWESERTPLRVIGLTFDLEDVPLRMVSIALEQTEDAKRNVLEVMASAIAAEGTVTRERWWKMARQLKQPLLTLSLLPENLFGDTTNTVSVMQLRRWQLEQLGATLREVDEACWSRDAQQLPKILEARVMAWLSKLGDSLELWREILLARAER
jgi:hypothetical protein